MSHRSLPIELLGFTSAMCQTCNLAVGKGVTHLPLLLSGTALSVLTVILWLICKHVFENWNQIPLNCIFVHLCHRRGFQEVCEHQNECLFIKGIAGFLMMLANETYNLWPVIASLLWLLHACWRDTHKTRANLTAGIIRKVTHTFSKKLQTLPPPHP